MKNSLLILSVCIAFISTTTNAQDMHNGMFKTKKGKVLITGMFDSTQIVATSNNLTMLFNFDNGEIKAKLDLSNIRTGIDSLDKLLKLSFETAYFTGKMGVDYIIAQSQHHVLFDIEGALTLNSISKHIKIKTDMYHITSGGDVASTMTGSCSISLKDFNLTALLSHFSDQITIQFVQVVLKRTPQ